MGGYTLKARRVETAYVCTRKECGSPLSSSRFLTGQELDDVIESIEVEDQCYCCRHKTLRLTHAVIHLQSPLYKDNSEYGDVRFGLWRCPNHASMTYYPKLLQSAMEGGSYNSVQYKSIADRGRPFRCPICETELLYMDERTIACAYC